MAKVLLIDIPLAKKKKFGLFLSKFGSRFPPLNIILLGTILEQNGHTVDFIFEDESYEDVRQTLIRFRPEIIGITCMTMSYDYLKDIVKIIRQWSKDINIITGGFHPSIFPEKVMEENSDLTVAFIGEADNTIASVVNLLTRDNIQYNELQEIPNIVFRLSDGSLHKTSHAPPIDNMDELPFPNYSLVQGYFSRFHPAFNRHFLPYPSVSLNISRGCPFKCNFCGRSVTGSKIRSHSIAYRIELIKHLKKTYNIRSIVYTDELLTFRKNDILEFCEKILSEGLQDIQWVCSGRVDTLDDRICQMMVRAGCKQIGFGLESGSPEILKNINKNTSVDKAKSALDICRKNNLGTFATFMLGCFGETISTLRTTYDFIMSNPIDYVVLCYFTPMPGSESYDLYKNYGDLLTTDFRQFNTFSGLVFVPFGLKKEEIIYWRKKIYRDFYLRPSRIMSEMKYLMCVPSWKYIGRMLFR